MLPGNDARFAMANDFTLAIRGADGDVSISRQGEWLVLETLAGTDFLSVSDSEPLDLNDDFSRAPDTLEPKNTFIGAHYSQLSDAMVYSVIDSLGDLSEPVAGNFFPSEGFFRIEAIGDNILLNGSGRFESGENRVVWQFNARRYPWVGDRNIE